jgi:hypothetical protein
MMVYFEQILRMQSKIWLTIKVRSDECYLWQLRSHTTEQKSTHNNIFFLKKEKKEKKDTCVEIVLKLFNNKGSWLSIQKGWFLLLFMDSRFFVCLFVCLFVCSKSNLSYFSCFPMYNTEFVSAQFLTACSYAVMEMLSHADTFNMPHSPGLVPPWFQSSFCSFRASVTSKHCFAETATPKDLLNVDVKFYDPVNMHNLLATPDGIPFKWRKSFLQLWAHSFVSHIQTKRLASDRQYLALFQWNIDQL